MAAPATTPSSAGSGTDWLFGGSGNDRIYCGSGNDAAIGGSGTDQIYGGSGNDILAGGYDFQLHYLVQTGLNPILNTWAAQQQVPQQLAYNPAVPGSSPNLAIWDSGAADTLVRGTGRTLFYAGAQRQDRRPAPQRRRREDRD